MSKNSNEKISFNDLDLTNEIKKAIDDLGFETPTDIQARAIPLVRSGADVIGKSQTGTGKTMAFSIPAIEMINSCSDRSHVLAIIMLPTRELAMQCCGEIKKLTKYCERIRPVEVYGGAPMDRQIKALKRANIVIGTPGRIMDHMRRRTLKLDHVKLAVLDEADEMLSMGFKEDMETILRETPESRQTVLFSATMPPAIMSITEEFQNNPEIIEINSKKVTLDNIRQTYVDVPMGRKTDALKLLLYYYAPSLSIVFCNTKKMAEEVAVSLNQSGLDAEALHGDLKQSQRTAVMDKFRYGSTSILVATDVAARGIDVNDVEYVFNYDIPQNNEYYVHRIGRTGRIGKEGNSVTICSGRRQVLSLLDIAHSVKSKIEQIDVPSGEDINYHIAEKNMESVENALNEPISDRYREMVNMLLSKGFSLFDLAAAAMQMNFSEKEIKIKDIRTERKQYNRNDNMDFSKIMLNIGRSNRVAPNHIVASITERSLLHGRDIGKIEIYDDCSVVAVPTDSVEIVLDQMYGAKVCGKPVRTVLYEEPQRNRKNHPKGNDKNYSRRNDYGKRKNDNKKKTAKNAYRKAAKRHG